MQKMAPSTLSNLRSACHFSTLLSISSLVIPRKQSSLRSLSFFFPYMFVFKMWSGTTKLLCKCWFLFLLYPFVNKLLFKMQECRRLKFYPHGRHCQVTILVTYKWLKLATSFWILKAYPYNIMYALFLPKIYFVFIIVCASLIEFFF